MVFAVAIYLLSLKENRCKHLWLEKHKEIHIQKTEEDLLVSSLDTMSRTREEQVSFSVTGDHECNSSIAYNVILGRPKYQIVD